MNAYEKIRAALSSAKITSLGGLAKQAEEALAALAELEKTAAEPVTYQYSHPSGGGKIWRNEQHWNGYTSNEARALYAAPPAPVAEIREPTPEECERICTEYERLLMREGTCGGRDAFDAVRAVLWPKEG